MYTEENHIPNAGFAKLVSISINFIEDFLTLQMGFAGIAVGAAMVRFFSFKILTLSFYDSLLTL